MPIPAPYTLAATGHRPPKLGGYSATARERLYIHALAQLRHHQPAQVISGMALGWDTAIAQAAINLNIPLIAAIPFPEQPSRWLTEDVQVWRHIRGMAEQVHIVCPAWEPEAFQLRNIWMVNRCSLLLACWDGSSGGTSNCLSYARRSHHAIIIENCYQPHLREPAL